MAAKAGVWKPTTFRAFRIYLNAVILPALGDRAVNRLTSADIADWFHTYSATRPGGANQALAHLRSLLRFARETGLLPPDAADPSKPVRRNTRRARGRLLTVRQIERLGAWLSAPPLRWIHMADAIRLILLTGCRSGEIARLSWSEVFADRLKLASTKTGAREVFLTPPALVILNRKRRGASSKFVFPHPQDARRPVGSVDGSWRAIRALIGLPDDIRLHDLRHTYASHAIVTGETLDIAGRLLSPEAVVGR